MSSTIKAFNNQLQNFINVLSDRFPDLSDLKVASTGVSTLIKYNTKKPIELFVKYTYTYRELIMTKNETQLLNTDFMTVVDKEDIDYASKIITIMKDNWKQLTDDEKENIWKYLQVLMKLIDKHLTEILSG
jgi:hypothetical protein